MLPNSISIKKRLLFILGFFTLLIIALILRVAWLQVVQGSELQKKALENQTRDSVINPQRGTIFDRNGIELAISASVDTVTASPNDIKNSTKVKPEEMAKTLSQILQMDEKDVLSKITQNKQYIVLKRKVDKSVADAIRLAQTEGKENKLPGINLIDDKKRFYPYSNFASYVIGFTGQDNQGLEGIEKKYNKFLEGDKGKIISITDARGREVPNSDEQYIKPQNGNDVYLTIDEVIQHFAEKALETAVNDNKVKRGTVIVMDPKTGEILALAVKPDFNLNEPFAPIDEGVKNTWDTLNNEQKTVELQKIWRNPAISDTYEPGSVFKMVTSAAALEENVVKPTDMFTCVGYAMVAGQKIRCWKTDGSHGVETFVKGVQNSCNPVFIEIAARMGAEKFYNYIKGFGFMDKTGIDLPGETPDTIFHKLNKIGPVELATYSFGQGFQITPMQMMTAMSAIANDGKLVRPRMVKQIKDEEGNVIQSFEPEVLRQVISTETSRLLRDILESVVSEGTGKNAYIEGYRIAGKTGTSEKLPRGSGKYIASFGAFAPADDPKLAVLALLDEPTAGTYYGGQIAAPVVKQIIDDSLRYMDVEPKFTAEELAKHSEVNVPDVRNMSLNQATKLLKENKLSYKIEGEGDSVVYQTPTPGYKLYENSPVFLFLNKNAQPSKKLVPNIKEATVAEATRILSETGLNIRINGSGQAVSQSPAAGSEVDPGTVVTVEFKHADIAD